MYNSFINDRRNIKMLFRKKIEKSCSYCEHSAQMDSGYIVCSKRGIQSDNASCCLFRYDPCKRIPFKAKAVDFSQFQDSDFSLEG